MHSTFLRFFFNSKHDVKLVLRFPSLHFQSRVFRSCIFYSCIFQSCIFRSCISGPAFSGPAFSCTAFWSLKLDIIGPSFSAPAFSIDSSWIFKRRAESTRLRSCASFTSVYTVCRAAEIARVGKKLQLYRESPRIGHMTSKTRFILYRSTLMNTNAESI